jgi:formyltetrahydrofolate deformylase
MGGLVILIQCRDRPGLVSRISTFVFDRGFNIVDCQQHVDCETGDFYMRLVVELQRAEEIPESLGAEFEVLAGELGLTYSVHSTHTLDRVAILVTKASHCLYDLLVRQCEGELRCEIPLVIGNHPDLADVARRFDVPFVCLPVSNDNRAEQQRRLDELLRGNGIDLVVLARYMQILGAEFIEAWRNRVINIHHAFLPAFQGANPYQRAYERGVKMIGATAHYATAELDEGPIIEQDVERVTHEDSPQQLARIGRDIERVVLARALKAHLERRVIVAGRKTIVFSARA